jgi:hypothetical protein
MGKFGIELVKLAATIAVAFTAVHATARGIEATERKLGKAKMPRMPRYGRRKKAVAKS